MHEEGTLKAPPPVARYTDEQPSFKALSRSSEGIMLKALPVNGFKEPPQAYACASYAANNPRALPLRGSLLVNTGSPALGSKAPTHEIEGTLDLLPKKRTANWPQHPSSSPTSSTPGVLTKANAQHSRALKILLFHEAL